MSRTASKRWWPVRGHNSKRNVGARPVGPTYIRMRVCEHEGKAMPMVEKSFLGLGAHGFHRIVYFE